MATPWTDLSFVVFNDRHPAYAVDTFRMPQREHWIVCLLALALGDFIWDVVVHVFLSQR